MKMINLSDREWSEFKLYDVFNAQRGKRLIAQHRNSGKVAYYSASFSNNGMTDLISNPLFVINTDAIVYSTFGDAFYANKGFTASDEITVLTNENLNRYVGLFFTRVILQNKSKYSFGRKAFSNKISKDKILLPIDNEGNPDWQFMEDCVRELEQLKVNKYVEYVQNKLESLEYREIEKLEDKEWKDFKIKEIFPSIQRGKRLTKANQVGGLIPYVSSTSMNNGVDNFIEYSHGMRKFGNCLSLANSGSVGACFYEPFDFIASDHVTHLKNEDLNQYVYLFASSLLNRLSSKYNFNREINDKRLSRETIILPVKEDETPDYEYMEQYVKNLMYQKYSKYLDYVNRSL